jgi:cytochrome c oxidase subunit II
MSAATQPETPTRNSSRRTRLAAQETARREAERRSRLLGGAAFALIALLVLGAGVYLAGGVFFGQRDTTNVASAVPMRISMAGFDPAVIRARPGQTVTLDWWNTDGAMHLQGGVHTMVSDTLGIRLELPAESRKTVTITAPMAPGDYDFWCDSCCGGKDNPKMHGTLHVAA